MAEVNERLRPVLVLILALAAALLTYRFLAGLRETTTVVVAATDIPAGTTINDSMLSTITVGQREQTLLVSTAIRDVSQVIGRAPKRLIKEGAVLKLDQDDFFLTDEAMKVATGGAVPPAYLVPQGFVAIAVPVEADSAVGFSLRKGDRVNVIFTWHKGEEAFSKTVLSNVEIFETGKADSGLGSNSQNLRTVTLLVTPEDAEKVTLAKRTGKIDLALNGK